MQTIMNRKTCHLMLEDKIDLDQRWLRQGNFLSVLSAAIKLTTACRHIMLELLDVQDNMFVL